MEYRSVVVPVVLLVLSVWTLFSFPAVQDLSPANRPRTPELQHDKAPENELTKFTGSEESAGGDLLPVLVEHSGEAAYYISDEETRTDTMPNQTYELLLPSGGPDNRYSALCSGGYFLVGEGGSADFGSAAGTISFWIKWHSTAPNGRPWGQHADFEIRWSGGQVVLDWGSDNTLVGAKADWIPDRWYFLAFTWNDSTNQICIYWADEYNMPTLDASTSAWSGSVVGFHTQSNIMNSRAGAYQTSGHIDSFGYFNTSRGLDDVQADYRSRLNPSSTGLVHLYDFEGHLVDSAGSSNLQVSGSVGYSKDVVSIDDSWKADQITVDVENLKTLCATMGTFDSGVPGTNTDWSGDGTYHPDGWLASRQVISTYGVQRAAYVESGGGYVTLQNEGYGLDSPTRWRHYDDTIISWYQEAENSDLDTNFILNLNYLYENGPIGTTYRNAFSLRFQIRDGGSLLWEWSVDPTTLSQRSVWFSVSQLAVTIPAGHSNLELRISLEVQYTAAYISLYQTSADLGGDPSNGKFVTFFIDNISLVVSNPPSCAHVGLAATLPFVGQTPVMGTAGQGHLIVSYVSWSEVSILLHFSSTSPISFTFSARISHMSRIENTSSSTVIGETGVSYQIEPNADASLTAYAYLPSHAEVTNLTLRVLHPADWAGTRVLDATGQNVSGQCYSGPNIVEVPSYLLDVLGWWRFDFLSPNYAKEIVMQAYRDSAWSNCTIVKNNDVARSTLVIGTDEVTPTQVDGVSLSWSQHSEMVWYSESLESGSGGVVESTPVSFGASNATVGEWFILVSWSNGTEVAFGKRTFELHHNAELEATASVIETNLGDIGTGAISLTDIDNGELLLDPSGAVVGNWSESVVTFRPNLSRMTWDSNLNTTELGTGSFVIVVNGSLQFYDISPCSFDLVVLSTTTLDFLDEEFVLVGLGESYSAQFAYEYHDSTGIEGANLSVIMYTGPENGLTWQPSEPVPGELGRYAIDFAATTSGTYHVFVSASKEYHQTSSASFYLIVGETPTQIMLLNGSAATTGPETAFRLVIRYLNATGFGLSDASVRVVSVTPNIGLGYASTQYLGNGTYSILLVPADYGAFSVLLGAELENYEAQYSVFTITVSPMSSILRTTTSVGSVAIDRTYTVYFTFLAENLTGLEGAEILAISVDPPSGVQIGDALELGNGTYSIVITPATKGTYELVFRAVLAKYQNATAAFTLFATEVPTSLVSHDGSASAVFYLGEPFYLTLLYQRSDTGANITMAAFTVSTGPGLLWSVSEANGSYVILVEATSASRWQLMITASRTDHRNGTLVYQLEVLERPTQLVGTGLPVTLFYSAEYTFTLRYETHDQVGITSASVTIPVSPSQGVRWREVGEGHYEFGFSASSLGSYELMIRFTAYGYATAEYSVQFQVIPSVTTVECHSQPLRFFDARRYVIAMCYRSATGEPIDGAEVAFSADIRSFVVLLAEGSGWYNITLEPSLGEYNATFYLTKSGFVEGRFSFKMAVELIPIVLSDGYHFNGTYSFVEGRMIDLAFAFIANDTCEPISDATAVYYVRAANDPRASPVRTGLLTYVSGVYTASFVVPSAGLYTIEILVERDNCQALFLEAYLVAETDSGVLWANMLRTAASTVGIFAAATASVYFGRGVYLTRRESRMRALLELRARLDDAERTIGLLVLHSKKGLPVFSKIVKGGFDESMVSGFISAITSFRDELAMEERLGLAIPISEVITAVRTRTLTCALLTVESPSKRQTANLEEFARSVNDLLGDSSEKADALSQDLNYQSEFSGALTELFNKKMDGPLLVRYTGISAGPLPDEFSQLPSAVEGMTLEEFTPGMLALALTGTGIDEYRSLALVIGAAERGLLTRVEVAPSEGA